jgi:hypothetical protein
MDAPDYDKLHEAYQRGRTVERFTGHLNGMMLMALGAGVGLMVAALMHKMAPMVILSWLLGVSAGYALKIVMDRFNRPSGDSGRKEEAN